MQKSRFYKPYKNGRCVFPKRGRSGVYLIKLKGEIVYVGSSGTDLYKAMYRHLQTWETYLPVVTYVDKLPDITVRVVYCTPKQATALEIMLIRKYQPKDNTAKYESFAAAGYDFKTLKQYEEENTRVVQLEEPVEVPF